MCKGLLKEGRWTTHSIILSQKHPVPYAVPVVQDAEMTQTGSLRHAGSARGKLNIHNVVVVQPLVLQSAAVPAIFQHMFISCGTLIHCTINSSLRVVNHDHIS